MLILKELGGIYLDLDNEVKNNFDILFYYDFFSGDLFSDAGGLSFMGAIPDHPNINRALKIATEICTVDDIIPKRECYKDRHLQYFLAGAKVMSMAYLLEANVKTRDIMLSLDVYNTEDCTPTNRVKPLPSPPEYEYKFDCLSFQKQENTWII